MMMMMMMIEMCSAGGKLKQTSSPKNQTMMRERKKERQSTSAREAQSDHDKEGANDRELWCGDQENQDDDDDNQKITKKRTTGAVRRAASKCDVSSLGFTCTVSLTGSQTNQKCAFLLAAGARQRRDYAAADCSAVGGN